MNKLSPLINKPKVKDHKLAIVLPVIVLWLNWQPVSGESPFLRKGIDAYNAGDYSKAAGQFGAAESAEFNNAVLHYYLANTLAHLNEREGAIREYRIAYALEPDGDVGRQCRLALSVYGADMFGSKPAKRNTKDPLATFGKITFSSDPVIQQAVTAMHKQVDDLTSNYNNGNTNLQPPPANIRNLNILRRAYRQQQQDNVKNASAAQESANNLENLLNNNSHHTAVKLDPNGTNLYIRKYTYPGASDQTQTSTSVNGKLLNSKPSGKE